VISTAVPLIVKASSNKSDAILILTNSNIAVKNVAEVLARQGFLDWLLLVSYEFHFDWHADQVYHHKLL
jgi:hypothetical protein